MPKSYLSPVITAIMDYDARHSSFLDTLKAYILHLGNTKKTAELLHITGILSCTGLTRSRN
ncbi:MAG: hypothetical protein ACLVJO_11720 [[Clostridium] scindens]